MQTIQKISFLCLAILFAQVASAQSFTHKGTTELGGDISFSSQKESESDYAITTFTFNPYIGKMISDGFELGIRPQFMTIGYNSHSINTLGIFLAPAYNINVGSNVYPYFELLVGYNSVSDDEDSYGGLGVGGSGGLKVNIKGNSLLLVKLEYLHQEYDVEDDSYSINTFSFGLGFRIFLLSQPTAAVK